MNKVLQWCRCLQLRQIIDMPNCEATPRDRLPLGMSTLRHSPMQGNLKINVCAQDSLHIQGYLRNPQVITFVPVH